MKTARLIAVAMLILSLASRGIAGWTTAGNTIYTTDDNIGIGTDHPITPLEIRSEYPQMMFRHDGSGSGFYMGMGTGAFAIKESGGDYVFWIEKGTGQIGIGTDSPDGRLAVVTSAGDAVRGETADREGIAVYGHANYTGDDYVGSTNYGGYFVAEGPRAQIGLGRESGTGIYARGNFRAAHFDGWVWIEGSTSIVGNVTIRKRISDTASSTLMTLGEGLDYAEGFHVSEERRAGPGCVLVIDSDHPGKLRVSDTAYDTKVAGIAAGGKGMGSGVRLGGEEFDCDVALAGRVYCNVDATQAGVEPGDLLTTASTPGYAMKVGDYRLAQGAILGKAMERLAKGDKGQILVLVTLQ